MPGRPPPSTGYQRPASLITLSNALDRLNAPIPSRPNTSLGFNATSASSTTTTVIDNANSDGSVKGKEKSVSNGAVPKPGATGLAARLNKVGTFIVNPNVAKRVFGSGVGPPKPSGVMGNRVFGKVSQKSSLPVVEGSPVKGAGTPMDVDEAAEPDDEVEVTGGTMPPPPIPFNVYRDPQPEASTSKSPAVHDEAWRRHASRRASYVMHNLSQSLSALPDSPPKRKEKAPMGPPPVPGTRKGLRSASAVASTSSKDSQSQAKTTPGASEKSKEETNGSGGSGKKKAPVLKILKSCIVFVDVKTDEGDEAGGLFVEMLKGLGARTLSSVGQTCTHIVFKNGHTNTVKRYRELEHKPEVVGVAWVVECAERRTKVDEEKFRVDLSLVHIPNFASRRRRSMLPQPPKIQPGDVADLGESLGQASNSFESAIESEPSTEGKGTICKERLSVSDQTTFSLSVDLSDLPPLERARRRSMLAKPHGFGSRA
ncbi:hypothetical protein BJ322DRAFT_1007657 [Thelephora terrestris]|uniref:BRCT domain-containing protein n=1 Tax=Thelephora terrestris TaxID=56493 RepID=A0A9P6HBN9_9AGAM|nr:hypothetical protein BJ322DRAFT_1007657 [Thelephora terrestris]